MISIFQRNVPMTDICFLTHQMQPVVGGMCTEQANLLF